MKYLYITEDIVRVPGRTRSESSYVDPPQGPTHVRTGLLRRLTSSAFRSKKRVATGENARGPTYDYTTPEHEHVPLAIDGRSNAPRSDSLEAHAFGTHSRYGLSHLRSSFSPGSRSPFATWARPRPCPAACTWRGSGRRRGIARKPTGRAASPWHAPTEARRP